MILATVDNGTAVPFQTIPEVINLQSGPPVVYNVQVVPQHGPIVPNIVDHKVVPANPATGAISIKWTGFEPTHEIEAIFSLLRSTDVDSAHTALDGFGVGGQNWMIGDTHGDIHADSNAESYADSRNRLRGLRQRAFRRNFGYD